MRQAGWQRSSGFGALFDTVDAKEGANAFFGKKGRRGLWGANFLPGRRKDGKPYLWQVKTSNQFCQMAKNDA